MHAQSPSPSEAKNLSPDKKWEYVAFYELHGDEWGMLESLAKANPISKTISKAISGGLAGERTKKHIKSKATSATEIVTRVHEWTDLIQLSSMLTKKTGRKRGRLFAPIFSLL
jgi:hypothetical protein